MPKPTSDQFSKSHLEVILQREFQRQNKDIHISGTSSPSLLALLIANGNSKEIINLPHLVITSSLQEARQFKQAMEFFDPVRSVYLLSSFDVSPYSGLDPKPQITRDRLQFLWAAQNAKNHDVFVTPLSALLQKCIPFKELSEFTLKVRANADLPIHFQQYFSEVGYQAAPLVEDVGQFSVRGGIVDIFSPAHEFPIRIELFGNTVETLRSFSHVDQRSITEIKEYSIIPAKEVIYRDDHLEDLLKKFRKSIENRDLDRDEVEDVLRSLTRKQTIPCLDYFLPFFYQNLDKVTDHFSTPLNIWHIEPNTTSREADEFYQTMKNDFINSEKQIIRPDFEQLFISAEKIQWPQDSRVVLFSNVESEDFSDSAEVNSSIFYPTHSINELIQPLSNQSFGGDPWNQTLLAKLNQWSNENYRIIFAIKNRVLYERLKLIIEKIDWNIQHFENTQDLFLNSSLESSSKSVFAVQNYIPESIRIPEDRLIFIRDEDIFGKKNRAKDRKSASDEFQDKAKRLAFGDLTPGDSVVHVKHGIGRYEGLKIMNISGVESEFIQISYKENDRLYLPVYRIGQLQKYSGINQTTILDKLGGTGWEKTKTKVRKHLKDIAADLLDLYAKREKLERPPFDLDEQNYLSFEAAFPYEETEDQLRAISDILKDMTSHKPMDRLVCGDVGFGKTEVAMRAAFLAAINKKQVAVLAPTTVLSFQHFETFKKRFQAWPIEIRELNRFVSPVEVKKTIQDLKSGKVDIIIGTHRLLSSDIQFKDLGLLIVDEEQKFGVTHKEKIKKVKNSIDTLTLSATPIPRTLNMSLYGVRDLSIINTAPVDRLPTRTFITKFEESNIRKSILSEIARGGQIYFIHNRVQSIYGLADEIRQLVPEARIRVGHGQLDEEELEKTMVAFFNHEIDILICTTIVESGMDVPRANTMFIDQAHMMGLSQLYQLRGRVGRSKQRAYCYLLLPKNKKLDKEAQERLKVLQENSALGSGIKIAQYDLELRGAGNILGEDQSGHVNSVGYEMYMDLLNEAIQQVKGEPAIDNELDPEINLRIAAMIPDDYIQDIRIRLSYYKALSEIRTPSDLERIEEELKDQFGELPDSTVNLMGLMLIRSVCKVLGIQDISAGLKNLSLKFSSTTKMKTETVMSLIMRENKKYSLTPDNRLNIRMNNISWPAAYDELNYLKTLI